MTSEQIDIIVLKSALSSTWAGTHTFSWHTQPSPSQLMSKQDFNSTGGITAQTELKYSYITVSSTSQVEKKYEKEIKINGCFMPRNTQRHKNRKKKNSFSLWAGFKALLQIQTGISGTQHS